MSKVQLKLPPFFASMLNEPGTDWLIIENEIEDGTTIGDLLEGLASSYPGFRKVVFNPDAGEVSEQVLVVLNDELLQEPDVSESKLNDGDRVILLHVYTGG